MLPLAACAARLPSAAAARSGGGCSNLALLRTRGSAGPDRRSSSGMKQCSKDGEWRGCCHHASVCSRMTLLRVVQMHIAAAHALFPAPTIRIRPPADGKTFKKPRRPYEKERLDAELKLVGEYGLRNKRELWRVQMVLSKIRNAARTLLTLDEKDTKRIFEGQALMRRMYKYGLLNESQDKLDYVLALSPQVRACTGVWRASSGSTGTGRGRGWWPVVLV